MEEQEKEYRNVLMEKLQCEQLIKKLKEHLVNLDKEITEAYKGVVEKTALPGGILEHKKKHGRCRKLIRIQEEFLYHDSVNFNHLMSINKNLLEEIAHLTQQKEIRHDIKDKLDQELEAQRSMIDKLEADILPPPDPTSKAETQMPAEEEGQFNLRRMNLKAAIEHNAKLLTFMETKLQEITLQVEKKVSENKKKQEAELDLYRLCYRKLVEATGETDPNQIGLAFTKNKETNFTLMNYATDCRKRLGTLETRVEQMKSHLQFLEEDGNQSASAPKDLESELKEKLEEADSLEDEHRHILSTMNQLIAAVHIPSDQIPKNLDVTEDTLQDILGVLEEKLNKVLLQSISTEREQKVHMNTDLLPDSEAVVERKKRRSSSGWSSKGSV